jgi:hypothetical protein
LKIDWPETSKNRLIQIANLIKKGFAKWEKLPKKTRNIAAGASLVTSGILVPKFIFLLCISAFFGGRHLYLNGELEEAANEVTITGDRVNIEEAQDFGHP